MDEARSRRIQIDDAVRAQHTMCGHSARASRALLDWRIWRAKNGCGWW